MPDGLAVQTHAVAESDRSASISVWDGTITESGRSVDFMSADFLRIGEGLAAEHWDTADYVRLYQSFGLLPGDVEDAQRQLRPSRRYDQRGIKLRLLAGLGNDRPRVAQASCRSRSADRGWLISRLARSRGGSQKRRDVRARGPLPPP
jgi:hypothetical protein